MDPLLANTIVGTLMSLVASLIYWGFLIADFINHNKVKTPLIVLNSVASFVAVVVLAWCYWDYKHQNVRRPRQLPHSNSSHELAARHV